MKNSLILSLILFFSLASFGEFGSTESFSELTSLSDIKSIINDDLTIGFDLKPTPYLRPESEVEVFNADGRRKIENINQRCEEIKYQDLETHHKHAAVQEKLKQIRHQLLLTNLTQEEFLNLSHELGVLVAEYRQLVEKIVHLSRTDFTSRIYSVRVLWSIKQENIETIQFFKDKNKNQQREDRIQDYLDYKNGVGQQLAMPGGFYAKPRLSADLFYHSQLKAHARDYTITRYDGFLEEAAVFILSIDGGHFNLNNDFYTFALKAKMSLIEYCQILPGFGAEVRLEYVQPFDSKTKINLSEKVLLYVR